jgi:NAD-dependent dihydropyrimidine dehydrogenase PreA subunit/flavodoxin
VKVVIIYFSPCGSTDKVANLIKSEFEEFEWEVQLLNMTKDNDLFPDRDYQKFINRIGKHDLLLIGGPIYIDHLHYNVLDLIKELPQADDLVYTSNAGVFTTFGKITPGVGSLEASIELGKRGRSTWAALEVDSEHCISRNIDYPISEGLPGEEVLPLVGDFVKYLIEVVNGDKKPLEDIKSKLTGRLAEFPNLADERLVIDNSFPSVRFDYDLCGQCYLCIEKCPVNYLVIKNGYPATLGEDICIHCTNCLYYCPSGAVVMDLYNKKEFFIKQLAEQDLKPDGLSISRLIK